MAMYEGIHCALLTPFNERYALDVDKLSSLVDSLIDRKVHGFVANASTGQFATLSPEERRAFLETVIAASGGRAWVTAQVGAMTTAEAVAAAGHALDAGAGAILAIPPYYEGLEEREVESYYRALAEVGLPVMLYNNPDVTGWSMRPEFIARLATIEGVVAIKDATPETVERVFRMQQLCGDSLEYVCGMDDAGFTVFAAGSRAAIWGAANPIPEACVQLWELTVEKQDMDAARVLWRAMYPVARFMLSGDVAFSTAVRAATAIRWMDLGEARPPVLPMADELRPELTQLLSNLDAVLATA